MTKIPKGTQPWGVGVAKGKLPDGTEIILQMTIWRQPQDNNPGQEEK